MDYKFLSTEDLRGTSVSECELERGLDLATAAERPLTGFESHFLDCIKGRALPACPKERALLNAVLEAYHENLEEGISFEQLEEQDEIDYWTVDAFMKRSPESPSMGYEEAFSIPSYDRITAAIDLKAFEEWKERPFDFSLPAE